MAMSALKIISDSDSAAYKDTVVCGFDSNQSAIEAVQAGTLGMDIAQLGFDMGYKAVEAAVAVLEDNSVEDYIDSGVMPEPLFSAFVRHERYDRAQCSCVTAKQQKRSGKPLLSVRSKSLRAAAQFS